MTMEEKKERAIEMYFEGEESVGEIAGILVATLNEVADWTGILEEA